MNKEFELQFNKAFLKEMPYLTKNAIKIYISLSYHRYKAKQQRKNSKSIKISHSEIRLNEFLNQEDNFYNEEYFGVCSDYDNYIKGIKLLEERELIKIKRSKTPNGKPLTNVYIFE